MKISKLEQRCFIYAFSSRVSEKISRTDILDNDKWFLRENIQDYRRYFCIINEKITSLVMGYCIRGILRIYKVPSNFLIVGKPVLLNYIVLPVITELPF